MSKLIKRSTEDRQYAASFANFPEITGGQTLSSVVSVTSVRKQGSGTLTVGSGVVAGNTVVFEVSGGNDGDSYIVFVVVLTNQSKQLTSPVPFVIDDSPRGTVS